MIGGGDARSNSTAQSTLGSLAQKLGGTGLFELNITSKGVTGSIGMGGIDVGGALYDLGKRGIDKAALTQYAKTAGADKGEIAYQAYVYGDWTAENTAARLASGKDELIFGGEDAVAQTVADGKGGRTITMQDAGNNNNNAVQLQHEAYRDGVVGANNQAETAQAVYAHTAMAARMRDAGLGLTMTQNLKNDLAVWDKFNGNAAAMAAYAGMAYDSSADYWKMMENGNVKWDGSLNLYDENGKLLKAYDGPSKDAKANSLAQILGIDVSEAKEMISSTTNGIYQTSDATKAGYFIQRDYVDNVFINYGGDMQATLAAAQAKFTNELTSPYSSVGTGVSEAGYDLILSMSPFAEAWNTAMFGQPIERGALSPQYSGVLWNSSRYDDAAITNAFEQIKQNWSLSNSNPLYSYIKDKTIDPVGIESHLNTKNIYEDGPYAGKRHSSTGASADLGTSGKNNPIYTVQNETLFLQNGNLQWDNPTANNGGFGYYLKTQTDDFTSYYAHMQSGTYASTMLQNIITTANNANLYRVTLPGGYQIGNVGATGNFVNASPMMGLYTRNFALTFTANGGTVPSAIASKDARNLVPNGFSLGVKVRF